MTPVCQMLNIFSLGCFVIVGYQSYSGGVISEFDDGVCGVYRRTVVRKYGIEEGAEDTSLGGVDVQDEGR